MRILAATDFSARADRALRRAVILARAHGGELLLMHVVDDDAPAHLVKTARREADELLKKISESVERLDGAACAYRITAGSAAYAIVREAREARTDLIVIGEHRRQILKDVFVGTTAERIVRLAAQPVLMAAAPPAGDYAKVMLTTDLSADSEEVVRRALALKLGDPATTLLVHAFAAPAAAMMSRAMLPDEHIEYHVEELSEEALRDLGTFASKLTLTGVQLNTAPVETSKAHALLEAAGAHKADLVVVGAHRERGLKRMLGSTTESILRQATMDVLVVPANLE